jgi:acyl-CoA thioester hydrolase
MVPTQLRVIYGDTDQMGVVYYANYLRYFEAGRNEFLRARGMRYREVEERFRVHLPVTEAQVRYQSPARYDDLLTVETSLEEVRRASATFGYRIRREGEVLATGHTVHACLGPDGRPQRMPAELHAALSRGEDAAGPAGG